MEKESDIATTERGTQLERYTYADVDLALRLLILNGGNRNATVEQLAERGIAVTSEAIKYWRDHAFARRYFNMRQELGRDVGEEVAGRAMERALQADDATGIFIEGAVREARAGEMTGRDMAQAARAMAQVLKDNVEKAQLLRDRPTEIRETRDPMEALKFLAQMGVLKADPEAPTPVTVDVNAVDVTASAVDPETAE